jgi:hypothetical protein
MNYEIAGFWLGCIEFVLISIIGLSHFYFKKEAATTDKLNALEQKMDGRTDNHAERITVLESGLKHALTAKDLDASLEKLYLKINNVSDSLSSLTGEFKHVSNSLDRLYDERSKKIMSLIDLENQEFRRQILNLLQGDSDASLNDSILKSEMAQLGYPIDTGRLKGMQILVAGYKQERCNGKTQHGDILCAEFLEDCTVEQLDNRQSGQGWL